MARLIKAAAALSALAALAAGLLCAGGREALLPLAITGATVFYHLAMRLGVGALYDRLMNNRADYTRSWYRPRPWEARAYAALGVQRWKGRAPAYDKSLFDPRRHSWHEIAQAMCQSELVHETIIILSFLPLLAALRWGAFPVFFITSLLGAALDAAFVVIQRHNRPTVVRLALRERERAARNADWGGAAE